MMVYSKIIYAKKDPEVKRSNLRPLIPHLTLYNAQLPAIMSIFNRISGLFLFFVLIFFGFIYSFALIFSSYYVGYSFLFFLNSLFNSFFFFIFLFVLILFFFFHFLNGIRHLIWDNGRGLNIIQMHKSAKIVLFFTVFFTLVFLCLNDITFRFFYILDSWLLSEYTAVLCYYSYPIYIYKVAKKEFTKLLDEGKIIPKIPLEAYENEFGEYYMIRLLFGPLLKVAFVLDFLRRTYITFIIGVFIFSYFFVSFYGSSLTFFAKSFFVLFCFCFLLAYRLFYEAAIAEPRNGKPVTWKAYKYYYKRALDWLSLEYFFYSTNVKKALFFLQDLYLLNDKRTIIKSNHIFVILLTIFSYFFIFKLSNYFSTLIFFTYSDGVLSYIFFNFYFIFMISSLFFFSFMFLTINHSLWSIQEFIDDYVHVEDLKEDFRFYLRLLSLLLIKFFFFFLFYWY